MYTGYEWEQCGRIAYYGKYSNPPWRPVLLALTEDCQLHQAAISFPMQLRQPGMKTQRNVLSWGDEANEVFITPGEVIMIPETGTFSDLNIEAEVRSAEVYIYIYIYSYMYIYIYKSAPAPALIRILT